MRYVVQSFRGILEFPCFEDRDSKSSNKLLRHGPSEHSRKEKAALDLQFSEKAKPVTKRREESPAELQTNIQVLQGKLDQKHHRKEFGINASN